MNTEIDRFEARLLVKRRVSVWGLGYLGYTKLLRLQSRGFFSDIFTFEEQRLASFKKGEYPTKVQKASWTSEGHLPALDYSKICIVNKTDDMFNNNVHILSFPGKGDAGGQNRLAELADCFIKNKDKAAGSLVLFQSAETPGDIERFFIKPLMDNGVDASFCTAFRADWTLEEFVFSRKKQIVSGWDEQALEKARFFLNVLDMAFDELSSIKEAEIYEGARKTLQYMVSTYINQLSMAYSSTNVRKMANHLINEIQAENMFPSIGPVDYKTAIAAEQLLEGSSRPEMLSMLRDAEPFNISAILSYAEIIKRRGIESCTVLGMSAMVDLKDVRLSSSRILAERLISLGIETRLHDPYYTADEINEILPGASFIDMDMFDSECVVVMTAHRAYRFWTQVDINRLCSSAKLIIDNPGLWENFDFSEGTIYHVPGDGKLEELK